MRMRAVRSLVVACVSVVGCLVILSTLTNTTPASPTALHTLVTHTHNHLNHLHNNIKEEIESFVTVPDPEVLHKLGFVEEPVLYPHTNWTNLTTPVIATAVSSIDVGDVAGIVGVASQVCAGAMLLVYTLDLSLRQLAQVESLCNDTCSVVPFDHSQYPSHVRNWRLHAYRPIIIQELLTRAGAVLWLDPSMRLVSPFPPSPPTNTTIPSDQRGGSHPEAGGILGSAPADGAGGSRSARVSLQSHITGNLLDSNQEAGGVNGSGLQTLYPADQASLLNLENRYVSLPREEGVEEAEDLQALPGAAVLDKPSAGYKRKLLYDSPRRSNVQASGVDSFSRISPSHRISKRNLDVEDLLDDDSTFVEEAYPINEEAQKKEARVPLHGTDGDPAHHSIDKADESSTATSGGGTDHMGNFFTRVNAHLSPPDTNTLAQGQLSSSISNNKHVNYARLDVMVPSPNKPIASNSVMKKPLDTVHVVEDLFSPITEVDESSLLGSWRQMAMEQRGVLAWQLADPLMGHLPTAALTHPGMFSAMHTPKHLYDFHQMSDGGAVLLYNTAAVHQHLLKPWLTCSLTHHCIQPIGAQDTGCRYDKKPLFRYSGCHLYDTSAFNVALGKMFGPHNHPYQPATAAPFTRTPPTPAPSTQAPFAWLEPAVAGAGGAGGRAALDRHELSDGRPAYGAAAAPAGGGQGYVMAGSRHSQLQKQRRPPRHRAAGSTQKQKPVDGDAAPVAAAAFTTEADSSSRAASRLDPHATSLSKAVYGSQ